MWSLNAAGPHQSPLYPSTRAAPCTACTSRSQSMGEQRGLSCGVHGKTGEQVTSHTTPQTNHTIHRASLFSSRYHSSLLLQFCFFKKKKKNQIQNLFSYAAAKEQVTWPHSTCFTPLFALWVQTTGFCVPVCPTASQAVPHVDSLRLREERDLPHVTQTLCRVSPAVPQAPFF